MKIIKKMMTFVVLTITLCTLAGCKILIVEDNYSLKEIKGILSANTESAKMRNGWTRLLIQMYSLIKKCLSNYSMSRICMTRYI